MALIWGKIMLIDIGIVNEPNKTLISVYPGDAAIILQLFVLRVAKKQIIAFELNYDLN